MTSVIGIDLSLTSTGLAGFRDGDLWVERIRSTGRKGDDLLARRERVSGIAQQVFPCVDWDDLLLAVVEAPSYASQHGSAHDRSGLWWLVVDMLHELDIPVATVSPQGRAKYATGKGRADKQEVFAAACNTYGRFPAMREVHDLGWRQGNDMADAVVLAAMGCRHLGMPVDDVSEAQHQAFLAADWPKGVSP